jgi:hypothetical protein
VSDDAVKADGTTGLTLAHVARPAWRTQTPEGQRVTEQEVRQTYVGRTCAWSTPRTRNRGRAAHAGTIEAYVPAGASLAAAEMTITKQSYSDVDARDVARHDRYLVREHRESLTRRMRKPRRFAPKCDSVEVKK